MLRFQPDGAGDFLCLTHTAPPPPAKREWILADHLRRPSRLNETAPVANGRMLPYSSVTASTTRVASRPSPFNSGSSGSTQVSSVPEPESVIVFDQLALDIAFDLQIAPGIQRKIVCSPGTAGISGSDTSFGRGPPPSFSLPL